MLVIYVCREDPVQCALYHNSCDENCDNRVYMAARTPVRGV